MSGGPAVTVSSSASLGLAPQAPEPLRQRWWRALCTFVLLAIALTAAAHWSRSGPVDDFFIFARYAGHLAHGLGPRFNPDGPAVEGFSSPLWLALLTAADIAGLDLGRAAVSLGLLCGALAALLIVPLSTGERGIWLSAPSLLLAASPCFAFWCGSGLETGLFAAATAAVVRCLLAAPVSPGALGVAIGVGCWVRPEGLLVVAPWVVGSSWLLSANRRAAAAMLLRTGAIVGGMVVPQILVRWFLFRAVVPNTYHAKVATSIPSRIVAGAEYLTRSAESNTGWVVVALVALLAAWNSRNLRVAALLAGAVWWTAGTIAVGGDHFGAGRFLVPATVLIAAAAGQGLAGGVRRGLARHCLHAGLLAGGLLLGLAYGSADLDRAQAEPVLAQAWLKVGRSLRRNEPPRTRLATLVAGAIPYASGFSAFDMCGLVSPEVLQGGRLLPDAMPGHQRSNVDALLAFDPDLIVFPSSGAYPEPQWGDLNAIDPTFFGALRDARADPRVQDRYVYQTYRLEDGTWVELLRRRPRKRT